MALEAAPEGVEVLLLDRRISNNGCSGGNSGNLSVIASSEVVLCCRASERGMATSWPLLAATFLHRGCRC